MHCRSLGRRHRERRSCLSLAHFLPGRSSFFLRLDKSAFNQSLSSRLIDQPKAIRTQPDAPIPPRHHHNDIPNIHQLQQMQQPSSRRGLAIIITVLNRDPSLGIPHPPRPYIVRSSADLLIRREQIRHKSLGFRLAFRYSSATSDEDAFLLRDGLRCDPGGNRIAAATTGYHGCGFGCFYASFRQRCVCLFVFFVVEPVALALLLFLLYSSRTRVPFATRTDDRASAIWQS